MLWKVQIIVPLEEEKRKKKIDFFYMHLLFSFL